MRQLWCSSCLEEIEHYPCPHCGYEPAEENQIHYALTGHILAGRYLVGRILGQGGFGITYLGFDLKLQSKVAIKEFYPSGHVSRHISMGTRLLWNHTQTAQDMRCNGVESFLREARKMSKVAHIPNVVGVRDLIEDNDTAYIIMNYIQGTTLKDVLAKEGPMGWDRAKEIFLPAIQTMVQVHKAGLVHRDLSPDNLMLQTDGQVQILDLGAAKDISVDGGLTSALVAKAGFSPLEQYSSTGQSGTWTDVYAMAATIYYTVTGTLPPPTTDRLDQDNLRWDLPRLQALPKQVVSALQKAMALRASDRTQTMEAFLAELTTKSETVASTATKSVAAIDPQPKKVPAEGEQQKKKRFLPLIAAVVCLLLAAVFLFGIQPQKPSSEAITPQGSNMLMPNQPGTVFGKNINRSKISVITFLNTLNAAPKTDYWDASQEQDGSVLAWLKADNQYYHLYIGAEGSVIAPSDASSLFYGYTNLWGIQFGYFDTSNVTDMRYMFSDCYALTQLNLSRFDTSSVTRMDSMFSGCSGLTQLDLSGFDTSSVTSMNSMFSGCTRLTQLNLADWDTSSVTNMNSMFSGCSKLTQLDLSGFDTSSVKDMCYMFYECFGLTQLDLSALDTSSVTNMNGMFSGCSKLTQLDLSALVTSSVTNMNSMFYDCFNLTQLDLSGFDTSSVTSMNSMFSGCTRLTQLNLADWDTSSVTNMGAMFYDCFNLTQLDLSGFDTSSVTSMNRMFSGCTGLTQLDLAGFNTSRVTDMKHMFSYCSSLTELDLSGFNTAGVADMSYMFNSCFSLTELNLSGFDTSMLSNTTGMFYYCNKLPEKYKHLP